MGMPRIGPLLSSRRLQLPATPHLRVCVHAEDTHAGCCIARSCSGTKRTQACPHMNTPYPNIASPSRALLAKLLCAMFSSPTLTYACVGLLLLGCMPQAAAYSRLGEYSRLPNWQVMNPRYDQCKPPASSCFFSVKPDGDRMPEMLLSMVPTRLETSTTEVRKTENAWTKGMASQQKND
eukprot:scaffold650_cov407-Prasinococcus_capsulatus_cf.AAC.44